MKKITIFLVTFILIFCLTCKNKIYCAEDDNNIICEQINEIIYKSKSTYAYESLSKLQNGKDYQAFYNYSFTEMCKYMNDFESSFKYQNDQSTLSYNIYLDQKNCNYETIERLTSREIFYVLKSLYLDNPIFYFLHYNMKSTYCFDDDIYIEIPQVYQNPETRKEFTIKIIEGVQKYSSIVENIGSEYTIAKVMQTEIAKNMSYEYIDGVASNTEYAHNILGLFVYNTGVCETYAQTFQLLLQYNGVECIQVHGNRGRDHAWNMAKMNNGLWYGFDLTNDDMDNNSSPVIFSDFCSADDDFKAIHRPYEPFGDTFSNYGFYDIPEFSTSSENMEDYYTITKDGITYKIYFDKLIPIEKENPDLELPDSIYFYNTNYSIMCLHSDKVIKDNCDYCECCNTMLHSFKKINGKEATCSEEGYTEKIYCTKCNLITQDSNIIPKLIHNESEWIILLEPTDTTNTYWHYVNNIPTVWE